MFKRLILPISVIAIGLPVMAHADAIGTKAVFTLSVDGCSGGCGTAPFATVTLTQTATGVVDVKEVLTTTVPPEGFVETGSGESLEWNLTGDPSITIGFITTGFAAVTPSNAGGFGTFDYAVSCGGISCGPGASTVNPGPLEFTVTDASGVNVSNFIDNSDGYFFLSDIIGSTGNTGPVAGNTPGTVTPPPVPEPSTLLLLGTGALGAAATLRRRFFSR